MPFQRASERVSRSSRPVIGTIAGLVALVCFATLPAQSSAAPKISIGAGETSIIVNGQEISTSQLTLGQLAQDQGVPSTVVPATVHARPFHEGNVVGMWAGSSYAGLLGCSLVGVDVTHPKLSALTE